MSTTASGGGSPSPAATSAWAHAPRDGSAVMPPRPIPAPRPPRSWPGPPGGCGQRCGGAGTLPELRHPGRQPACPAACTASFAIGVAAHELRGPAGRVRVGHQVALLAAALLRAPGQVVPYAAVAAALWPPPAALPVWHRQNVRQVASKLRTMLAHVGAEEEVQALRHVGLCIVPPAPGHKEPSPAPEVRGLALDRVTGTVRHGRQEVVLGRQETAILGALLAAGGLVTGAELLAAMYPAGDQPRAANGALRVKLTLLRRKLRSAGVPVEIAATYGAGYRLRAAERAAAGP